MYQTQFGPRLTPGVKLLIIINSAVFALQVLMIMGLKMAGHAGTDQFTLMFALDSELVLHGYVWQIFTYQFLHSTASLIPYHILFNMLTLWMFGSDLEEKWGKRQFIKYYLICGTGAGIFIFLLPVLFRQASGYTLGASGATFGILLAYAIYWPDRRLLFMFLFPVKVKYYVLFFGIFSLFMTYNNSASGGISHVGHLGGLVTGYLYILSTINRSNRAHVFEAGAATSGPGLWQRFKNYRQRKLWLKRQKELFQMENMETQVDMLLEKISRKGYKSLSTAEKNFLKKASQNMNESKSGKPIPDDKKTPH